MLGRGLRLRLGSLAMDGRLILLELHSLFPLAGRLLTLLALLGLEARGWRSALLRSQVRL